MAQGQNYETPVRTELTTDRQKHRYKVKLNRYIYRNQHTQKYTNIYKDIHI